jgi:hypothetical protein
MRDVRRLREGAHPGAGARAARGALGAFAAALALFLATSGAGAATPAAGPHCTPTTLNASAQVAGVTVSPMPGAADASPQTQISMLGVPAAELADVSVSGSRSGAHPGKLEPYSQGDGASFVPKAPFDPGETVTVSASVAAPSGATALRFTFGVGIPDPVSRTPAPRRAPGAHSARSFVSRPDLRPPALTIEQRQGAALPGDLLLGPYGTTGEAGPMLLDPDGRLVFFRPLPRPMVATNVRVQALDGAPVLTWWQGTITTHGYGIGDDEVLSSSYRTLAVVHAGNGLAADLHEFQITPAGTALITAYEPLECDLAGDGGRASGAVTDSLVQEIDIATGLVRYEWSSLDHVPLSASYSSPAGSSSPWPFDFFHLNSINLESDGSLLVSSRNTWALDDIDPASGEVRWTLGGRASSFTEAPGAATAFQHDARPLGPDTFSVFDNGASPQVHRQSRGVVLALDPASNTVSVTQQFLHPGRPLLATSQGSMQALGDGSFLIGWGAEPDFSRFSASGELLLDASLPRGYESYRVLSFPWTGRPTDPPALALAHGAHGEEAYASWNGATGVARWELLAGRSAKALAHVGSVASTGFETAIPLEAGSRWVAVRALDATGAPLGTSRALKA